jgi:tripeptidyl-peptidase-1
MHFSSLLLLGLSGLSTSSPLTTHTVHEKRHALPVAWNRHSRAPKDAVLPVRIGLNQRNLQHADRFLEDVADPDSPNFGENIASVQVSNLPTSKLRKTLVC